ncbi:MAG: flagellar basal body M-ring protein FliF, partial [Chloroflexi bacterium]|nr:flagellar basal body M-ring protein FliF [Chloroflexota bacterium]
PSMIALVKEIAKNLLIAAVVLFLVFGVLRPLLKELATPPPRPVVQAEVEGVSGARPGRAGYEEHLMVAKQMAKQEPKIVAGVVKEWIGGNE